MKARIIETTLSSYQGFPVGQIPSENLATSEFRALKNLAGNENIVIQEAGKGNTIVILDTTFNISAIKELLNDHTQFFNLNIPIGKQINYLTNFEKNITSDLKLLNKGEIVDKITYKNIKPVWAKLGILYGLGSVIKETKKGLKTFSPVLPATDSLTYKLAKVFLPFSTLLNVNNCTIRDSYNFVE